GRAQQGCSLPGVPLLPGGVSPINAEIRDAEFRNAAHGDRVGATGVLLRGLPIHLADGHPPGTGPRRAGLAVSIHTLAPGSDSPRPARLTCGFHGLSARHVKKRATPAMRMLKPPSVYISCSMLLG